MSQDTSSAGTGDATQASTPAAEEATQAARGSWRDYLPSKMQLMGSAIVLLLLSNAGTWIYLQRHKPLEVATVGVRDMTRQYIAQLAGSKVSPEQARVRTEMFLSVSQDTMRRMALKQGVVVVARECVVAGESEDITKDVQSAVNAALTKAVMAPIIGAPASGGSAKGGS